MNDLEEIVLEMIEELEAQLEKESEFSGPFRDFNTEPKLEALEEALARLDKKRIK